MAKRCSFSLGRSLKVRIDSKVNLLLSYVEAIPVTLFQLNAYTIMENKTSTVATKHFKLQCSKFKKCDISAQADVLLNCVSCLRMQTI